MRSVSRLGLLSLKSKLWKFVFSFLSIFLSLSVLFVSASLYGYDERTVTSNAIRDNNITHFKLDETPNGEPSDYYLSADELASMTAAWGANNVVVPFESKSFSDSFYLNYDYDNVGQIAGEIENNSKYIYSLNELQGKSFGFSIVGHLPTENLGDSDTEEIVLSRYLCYELGWVTASEYDNPQVYLGLLDSKTYSYRFSDTAAITHLNVSGIIDTGFPINWKLDSKNSVISNEALLSELHQSVIVSHTLYNQVYEYESGIESIVYPCVYISTQNDNYQKAQSFVADHPEKDYRTWFRLDSDIANIRNFQHTLRELSLVIGLILLAISFFIYMNFVITCIASNAKTIKVLRSIGSSYLDTLKIFSMQGLLISVSVVALSLIPYGVGIYLINDLLAKTLSLTISIVTFNYWIPALAIIGLLIISILISGLYIAVQFSKKRIFS